MGLNHDRPNAGNSSPSFPYAYGYSVNGLARDVMAYDCSVSRMPEAADLLDSPLQFPRHRRPRGNRQRRQRPGAQRNVYGRREFPPGRVHGHGVDCIREFSERWRFGERQCECRRSLLHLDGNIQQWPGGDHHERLERNRQRGRHLRRRREPRPGVADLAVAIGDKTIAIFQAGRNNLGDVDGDGQRRSPIYRPSTGSWQLLRSSTGFHRRRRLLVGREHRSPA